MKLADRLSHNVNQDEGQPPAPAATAPLQHGLTRSLSSLRQSARHEVARVGPHSPAHQASLSSASCSTFSSFTCHATRTGRNASSHTTRQGRRFDRPGLSPGEALGCFRFPRRQPTTGLPRSKAAILPIAPHASLSALDFAKHVTQPYPKRTPKHGEDQQSRLLIHQLYHAAAAAIIARESCMESIVDDVVSKGCTTLSTWGSTAVGKLREYTLLAVEAIVDWRRAECRSPKNLSAANKKPPFMWEGQNFLLRLATGEDTEQLLNTSAAVLDAITAQYGDSAPPIVRNPFLLDVDLDTLASEYDAERDSRDAVRFPSDQLEEETAQRLFRLRLRRAARSILAEELAAHAEQQCASSETPRIVLTESEAQRLLPPVVDPGDLDTVAVQCPRLPIVATLACLHVLLHPELTRTPGRGLPPIERLRTRPLRYTLLKSPRRLIAKLAAFDPTVPTSRSILRLLWPVLMSERLTVDEVRECSTTVARLHEWMQALVVIHFSHPAAQRSSKAGQHKKPRPDCNRIQGEELLNPETVEIYTAALGVSGSRDSAENRVAEVMRNVKAFDTEDHNDIERDDSETVPRGTTSHTCDEEARKKLECLRNDLAVLKSEMLSLHQHTHQQSAEHGFDGNNAVSSATAQTLVYCSSSFQLVDTMVELTIYAVVSEGCIAIPACPQPLERPLSLMAQYLVLCAVSVVGQTAWQPRTLPAVEVDRITGYIPSEFVSMACATDRCQALQPLLNAISRNSSEAPVARLAILAESGQRQLHSSTRVVTGVCVKIVVHLRRTDSDNENQETEVREVSVPAHTRHIEGLQLRLEAYPACSFDDRRLRPDTTNDVLALDLDTDNLELLLLHQPALYKRAYTRWKALCAVADWTVARLSFKRTARSRPSLLPTADGGYHFQLELNRSIPLPPSFSQLFLVPIESTFELDLNRHNTGIELTLVASDPDSPAIKCSQIESLALSVDEVRALCSHLACDRLNGEHSDSGCGILSALSHRIKVEWKPKSSVSSAPTSQDSSLSMTSTYELPILRLDRVVYREVRRISGKSVVLQALAIGTNLVFEAALVSFPEVDRGIRNSNDDGIESSPPHGRPFPTNRYPAASTSAGEFDCEGEFDLTYTKVLNEHDLRLLVASELPEHQRLLLHAVNRASLAYYLADKLKLVERQQTKKKSRESSAGNLPRYELETILKREKLSLPVGVNGASQRTIIGTVIVDDGTTLEQVRRTIALELDDEDVPDEYRFLYKRAPCALRQEPYRLAMNCRPVLVLLTRKLPDRSGRDRISWISRFVDGRKWVRAAALENEGLAEKSHGKLKTKGQQSILRSSRNTFFSKLRGTFRAESESSCGASLGRERFDEAAPPSSLPLLLDPDAPSSLQTVAIPLGTTARACEGSPLIELSDCMSQLDLSSHDIIRIGNRNGCDFSIIVMDSNEDDKGTARLSGKTVVLTQPYEHARASNSRTVATRAPDAECVTQSRTSHKVEDDYDPHTLILIDFEEQKRKKLLEAEASPLIPTGTIFEELVVYKLIPKALDLRPHWRIDYDNGNVDYHMGDFAGSRKRIVRFGVPLYYSALESLVVDARTQTEKIHMQRVQFLEEVSVDHLIDEIFKMLCSWYPVSEGVDGAKWAKFARDNILIPDASNSARAAQIDIAFKRQLKSESQGGKPVTQKSGGRLNRARLKEAITELAFIKYPQPPGLNESSHLSGSTRTRSVYSRSLRPRSASTQSSPLSPASTSSQTGTNSFAYNARRDGSASGSASAKSDDTDETRRLSLLQRLLLEQVVTIPEISRRAWLEAKLLAMLAEGTRQSAATRMQTFFRKGMQRCAYRIVVCAATTIQAKIRHFLARKHHCLQRAIIYANFLIRRRCAAAYRLQLSWRNYMIGCDYRERQRAQREEYRIRLAERRIEQRERASILRESVVFRRVKFVNGWIVKTIVRRLNVSRATANTDFGLKLQAYVPHTQQTFSFKMSDDEVRQSLEIILGLDGLSGSEILDPFALGRIADRLTVRVNNKRPVVIFTRRGHSERGTQVLRRGLVISGEAYVLTAFRSDDEVVFHAYSGKTCETLRTSVTTKYLEQWILADHQESLEKAAIDRQRRLALARKVIKLANSGVSVDVEEFEQAQRLLKEEEQSAEMNFTRTTTESDALLTDGRDDDKGLGTALNRNWASAGASAQRGYEERLAENSSMKDDGPLNLLTKENLQKLLIWLMSKLHVTMYERLGTREKRRRLVFNHELDELKQEKAALVLQGMWQMRRSLKRIRQMVRANWEKRFDATSCQYYYVDLRTENMYWAKPLLLGSDDLPLAPDEWRQMVDEHGSLYYLNPATGQSSWLSMDDAARTMQRVYRKKQAADFGQPSFEDMVRALRMQNEVEKKYASTPERLSSIVNYALLLHTQRFDFHQARKLYKNAIEISPENPVLLRAHAIFMLLVLEPPRQVVFEKTLDMFKNAELRDPGRVRFKLTEDSMFHWAVIAQRDHPLALLNYALMLQTVVGDYDRAERFYHRAIGALKPNDKARQNCVENFDTFEVERLPGGVYSSPFPSGTVLRNSELFEERPEWGEFKRMIHSNPLKPDATFHFWLNKLTARGTWAEPNWEVEHQKRISRSEFVSEKQGWREYYDPRLDCNFFHNPNDMKVTGVDPMQTVPLPNVVAGDN